MRKILQHISKKTENYGAILAAVSHKCFFNFKRNKTNQKH